MRGKKTEREIEMRARERAGNGPASKEVDS